MSVSNLLVVVMLVASVCCVSVDMVVVGRLVNVRAGPAITHPVTGQLRNGQLVSVDSASITPLAKWLPIAQDKYVPAMYLAQKDQVKFTELGAQRKTSADLSTTKTGVLPTLFSAPFTQTPTKPVVPKVTSQKIFSNLFGTNAPQTSTLPVYHSVHIKGNTIVDTFNGVDAKYDTTSISETKYTTDEFVERYYKKAIMKNIILDKTGKPAQGFKMTANPTIGDLAVSATHRAIIKAAAGNYVALIEQNHKWTDKKGGFYAPKNRRLTITNGMGRDAKGTTYVFYTPAF